MGSMHGLLCILKRERSFLLWRSFPQAPETSADKNAATRTGLASFSQTIVSFGIPRILRLAHPLIRVSGFLIRREERNR